ncbi:hypothetical protein GVAV_002642 [Gurleya vavrai]
MPYDKDQMSTCSRFTNVFSCKRNFKEPEVTRYVVNHTDPNGKVDQQIENANNINSKEKIVDNRPKNDEKK